MRNMSFALTQKQILEQTKDVTRRFGWWFLKPGAVVQPVKKAMGLKKGEKIVKLGPAIEIVSTAGEFLDEITQEDCIREGFPEMTPFDFVDMITRHYRLTDIHKHVNRIEFKYILPKYWCSCGYFGSDTAGDACVSCGEDFPDPDSDGHDVACDCGCGEHEPICPQCDESRPFGLWDIGPADRRDELYKEHLQRMGEKTS